MGHKYVKEICFQDVDWTEVSRETIRGRSVLDTHRTFMLLSFN